MILPVLWRDPVTFTTAAFRTEAAYGCLKPAPTSWLRRALLHLRHSTVLHRNTFLAQQAPQLASRGVRTVSGQSRCRATGLPPKRPGRTPRPDVSGRMRGRVLGRQA